MRILVALAAFALAAVLVVSATMGADTLVPGAGDTKKTPSGGLAPADNGKARILPMGVSSLKGTGFKPGEKVTVKVVDGPRKTMRTTANGSGSFSVRLPAQVDRCNGMTVVAVGDQGSRASFQLSQLLCAAPGAGP